MSVWERYDFQNDITSEGSVVVTQLFHNEQADENFESSDVVIVDGILTFITDTDDLFGARLLVAPEELGVSDFILNVPEPHSPLVYYSWYVARGPLVFRLRSKRTVPPEHKLWMQIWKAQGSAVSKLRWGGHFLYVVKH